MFYFLGGHASKQQMSSLQEGESGVKYPGPQEPCSSSKSLNLFEAQIRCHIFPEL